jgi:hypothetical protein
MNDREVKLKATALQLSRVIYALKDLHETVLPKDPRMYSILSEADIDMLDKLCSDLRDLLGVEFKEPADVIRDSELPAPVLLPETGIPPTSVAAKE